MEYKAFLFSLLLLALACAPSYQQGGRFRPTGGFDQQYPPRPFRFDYNHVGDLGSTNYHQAQGDGAGKVSGTYGYTGEDGVFRIVQYEADVNGYRANVRTNEPGTKAENPADAVFVVEPVPQAVISKYGAPFGARAG